MKPPACLFAFFLFCSLLLQFCPAASAQFAELDNSAEKIAKKLKGQKPHMVAVPDFTLADGSPSPIGKHFAELVAAFIPRHAKSVPVAKRDSFISAFGPKGPTNTDLDSRETRNRLSSVLHVDFVVIGTVDLNESTYSVHLTTRRSFDGFVVIEQSLIMNRTPFTDSLSEPFPPQSQSDVPRAASPDGKAFKNVTLPTCIYCPQPSYTELARSQKIQATALFDVIVSASGTAAAVHPAKLAGYGLDEQAFNAIMGWRFKPALVDGQPHAVIVQIEVTFHLY
jgi:TonB family protein